MENEENKKKELEAALNEIVYCDLIKKKEINTNLIYLKSFPSGNIIAVFDKYIIIYDIDFNEIQKIENAHEDLIHYVDIKDENNFVTCSDDLNIKTWVKINGKY
jgi:tricorn protease-like protein